MGANGNNHEQEGREGVSASEERNDDEWGNREAWGGGLPRVVTKKFPAGVHFVQDGCLPLAKRRTYEVHKDQRFKTLQARRLARLARKAHIRTLTHNKKSDDPPLSLAPVNYPLCRNHRIPSHGCVHQTEIDQTSARHPN